MDKKIFNEKDSLELITEMIRSAKQRLEKNSGLPFLISGYLIIIMITASWFLLNHHPYWFHSQIRTFHAQAHDQSKLHYPSELIS